MAFIVPIIGAVAGGIGSAVGAIGGASGLVSLGLTAASGVMQYQAQRGMAKTAEATANYNAKLQENAAIQGEMESREEARRERARAEAFKSSQRAAIGASGATFAGSPLEVLGETAGQIELGRLDASRAAELARRRGMNSAQMTRWEGGQLAKGYRKQAFGTLLSTGAGLAKDWKDLKG